MMQTAANEAGAAEEPVEPLSARACVCVCVFAGLAPVAFATSERLCRVHKKLRLD